MPLFKLVNLGSGAVGKSSITLQFIQNKFIESYDPTIENSYRKQIVIDSESCMLEILDTAGQEEYSAMRSNYIQMGEAFILVYSITDKKSFEMIPDLFEEIQRVRDTDRVPTILVGNKCDLEVDREVATLQGQELAKKLGCPFFETSAKTGKNVEPAFIELIRVAKTFQNGKESVKSNEGENEKKKKKSGCNLI